MLVDRLRDLAKGRALLIAMESTGTYGDALRQALTDAGLVVHRVSGKAVHDYAEIFDGVPSQHDGKDAAIVAELAALGKSSPWPYRPPTEFDQELRYWVERADVQQRIGIMWLCRLEALLARHWPEATEHLELNSETLLQVLAQYGGPAALAAEAGAAKRLKGWGRHYLKEEKIERFVRAAARSVGVRQTAVDRRQMQEYAEAALAAKHEVRKASTTLEKLAQSNAIIARQAAVVGWATACVLWVYIGDPRNYHCAEAYRKAMGLNLKERSSGRHKGHLKITKRGPGGVRRWLFFAAMRLVQTVEVAEWYAVKKSQHTKGGTRALVAVMRKLALGLHALGTGEESFDARRLFSPAVKRSHRAAKRAQKDAEEAGLVPGPSGRDGPAGRVPERPRDPAGHGHRPRRDRQDRDGLPPAQGPGGLPDPRRGRRGHGHGGRDRLPEPQRRAQGGLPDPGRGPAAAAAGRGGRAAAAPLPEPAAQPDGDDAGPARGLPGRGARGRAARQPRVGHGHRAGNSRRAGATRGAERGSDRVGPRDHDDRHHPGDADGAAGRRASPATPAAAGRGPRCS